MKDLQQGSTLSKFKVFDPCNWPAYSWAQGTEIQRQEFASYGLDSIADICNYFQAHLDKEGKCTDDALSEYRHFKIYAKSMRSTGLKMIFLDILSSGRVDHNTVSNIIKLLK